MICRILHLQSEQEWVKASQWLDGRFNPGDSVEGSVREILADVREKGDEALIDYTRRFDCPEFAAPLRVSEQDIAWAAASISPEHREQISEAAHNIRTFHKEQLEKSWFQTRPDGSILGQRVLPVDRVGLYVPGGQGGNTPLLSSMLMNAIPALVAGVPRVAVCTPPRKDGTINPHILAAAHLLDIDEIYRVGGAWSIGALAYGTQSIDPVDVIAGPGNIYVATAKRLVQGTVGIDMVAGPSEVLVVADSSARPHWLAADMLSQAEHDMLASAILLTDENDRRFATGFPSSNGAVIVTVHQAFFITDARYIEAARAALTGIAQVLLCSREAPMRTLVQGILREANVQILGGEEQTTSYAEFTAYEQLFGLKLQPAQNLIRNLRAAKQPEELAMMYQAQQITDEAFAQICTVIRPGMTEREIAAELIYRMLRLGAEGMSFDPIVLTGPDTSMPHGVPGDRRVAAGDFVTMDFGCRKNGYCSDMTRTVAVGMPSDEMRTVYQTVLDAQLAGIAAAKAGVTGERVDAAARKVILKIQAAE